MYAVLSNLNSSCMYVCMYVDGYALAKLENLRYRQSVRNHHKGISDMSGVSAQ